jgi:hypothetical protein
MVRTETHSTSCRLLDRPRASSGARPPSDSVPCCTGEPAPLLPSPIARAEDAIPGWDSLWVDLGGEG